MELPIKIMMVLFVSLIVAWSMIQFSGNIINDSRVKLSDASKKHDIKGAEDSIVDIGTVSANQIFYLAEECRNKGKDNLPTRTLCVVARFDGTVDPIDIRGAWTAAGYPAGELNIAAGVGARSVFIYYNPHHDPQRVEIEP